jgi:hypothetical protein
LLYPTEYLQRESGFCGGFLGLHYTNAQKPLRKPVADGQYTQYTKIMYIFA